MVTSKKNKDKKKDVAIDKEKELCKRFSFLQASRLLRKSTLDVINLPNGAEVEEAFGINYRTSLCAHQSEPAWHSLTT